MDGLTRASGPVAAAGFTTNRVEREVGLNERVRMEVAISDFLTAAVAIMGSVEEEWCCSWMLLMYSRR